jgi:uncharacterized membrane protein YhaH (DUF805 family)
MKDRIIEFIKKLLENRRFRAANEHVIKPFIATVVLAVLFFIIIYNQGENARFQEPFFIYFAFLFPFLANAAVSFARLDKRKLYGAYGFSVVLIPFLAVNFYWLSSKYSQLPDFYREFNESGSFFMIYAMYSVFFAIGGVFLGMLDEFISSESRAVLKYPETGSLSKSKRRKLKKKKRDGVKAGSGAPREILDEIIGGGDVKPDGNDGADDEGDDDEGGGPADEENDGDDDDSNRKQ